ncbi:MAG: hypothetical protein K8S25_09475 [Alphaproteobacteria bacterium]|nr:hypothetical protein [Alphaproteobacteria bacterium]
MTTTVNGLFDSRDYAAAAVRDIKLAGIPNDEVSIVTNKVDGQASQRTADDRTDDNGMTGTGTTDGAAIGGVLGGGVGLAAGLGALTIPGIGPVLGIGWLVATAVGAAVGASGGGIIGALIGAGVDNDDAKIYVDRIRSGGTLVSVRVPDSDVHTIEAIMMKYKGMDADPVVANSTLETRTTRVSTARTTTPAE